MLPTLDYKNDTSFILDENRYRVCDFVVEELVSKPDENDNIQGINPAVVDHVDMVNKVVYHYVFRGKEYEWHFKNNKFSSTVFAERDGAEVECWEGSQDPRLYELPYDTIRIRLFTQDGNSIVVDENFNIIEENENG